MPYVERFASVLGRVMLAAVFLFAGFGKATAPAATKAYIAAAGLPFPDLAYLIAVAIEIGVAALFLIGFQTRLAAAALALFSIATALGFHHNFADQSQLINFMKNIAIAGGFLQVVAFGGGALSVDALMEKRIK